MDVLSACCWPIPGFHGIWSDAWAVAVVDRPVGTIPETRLDLSICARGAHVAPFVSAPVVSLALAFRIVWSIWLHVPVFARGAITTDTAHQMVDSVVAVLDEGRWEQPTILFERLALALPIEPTELIGRRSCGSSLLVHRFVLWRQLNRVPPVMLKASQLANACRDGEDSDHLVG